MQPMSSEGWKCNTSCSVTDSTVILKTYLNDAANIISSHESQISLTLAHLFLLTCIISYHGAFIIILYITDLNLMFLNTNPRAPKLAVKSFFLTIMLMWAKCFSLLLNFFFSFSWNRAGFCILAVYKQVPAGFISKCNCIPWKFAQPQFAYAKPFEASASSIPHLFEL